MPPLETMDRMQRAQVWRRNGVDRQGRFTVADEPDAIMVRWVDKQRERLSPKNERIGVDVTIVSDEVLRVGDILWKGDRDEWGTGTGTDDFPDTDLVQVMAMDVTTSICGKFTRYEAACVRYTNLLPLRR